MINNICICVTRDDDIPIEEFILEKCVAIFLVAR